MISIPNARERLLARRSQLARLQSENALEGRTMRELSEPDWVDRSANAEDRDLAETLAEGERRELEEIDAALERISSGRYGLCARCGESLEPERLAAVPETRCCIRCQTASERG